MCVFDHTKEACQELGMSLKSDMERVHLLSQEIKKAATTGCNVLKCCEVSQSTKFVLYELGRAGRGLLLGNTTGVKT